MNITFREDHLKENNSLFLALSGDKEAMKEQLKSILAQFDDSYGKPRQGITLGVWI